jgi:dCMP deaminase
VTSSIPSQSSRPDWDQTWIAVAKTIALRSLCSRDKVGAVVVSKQNRLLETGYNGPPSGFVTEDKPCSEWCQRAIGAAGSLKGSVMLDYSDCPSLHAEWNALLRGDRAAREGGTIYTTSHVCMTCAKAIANSGLSNLFIDSSISDPVWRNPTEVYRFLDKCGIEIYVA